MYRDVSKYIEILLMCLLSFVSKKKKKKKKKNEDSLAFWISDTIQPSIIST